MVKLDSKLQNLSGNLLRAGSREAPEVNTIYLTHLNRFPLFIWGSVMHRGYIKVWRKTLESDMYKSLTSTQRDVFLALLLLANHKPKTWEWKGNLFACNPGQFITSLDSIKRLCAKNVTIQNIRTVMDKFVKWGFLTNESTKTGRLITIINWEAYQGNGNRDVISARINTYFLHFAHSHIMYCGFNGYAILQSALLGTYEEWQCEYAHMGESPLHPTTWHEEHFNQALRARQGQGIRGKGSAAGHHQYRSSRCLEKRSKFR